MKLYSYVVDHDYGFAPNPYWRICTLAHCKSSEGKKGKRKNIVDRAAKGDWVVGTGGLSRKKSTGRHGRLIYAMKVTGHPTLADYFWKRRFAKKKPVPNGTYDQKQGDNFERDSKNQAGRVLISHRFIYYGQRAISIPRKFRAHKKHPLEKQGPGYRCNFDDRFVREFAQWIEKRMRKDGNGRRADPCGKDFKISKEKRERQRCKSSC